MTSQTPEVTEIEEMIKEARLAFYKRHVKQQYPKSLVTILDSFEVEFRQALLSQQQKHRETWLREEITKIALMKEPTPSANDHKEYNRGMREGVELMRQTIIDRYLLELKSIAQN